MADPKSAALPLGDAPNWSGPSIGSLLPGKTPTLPPPQGGRRKTNGPERDGPFLNAPGIANAAGRPYSVCAGLPCGSPPRFIVGPRPPPTIRPVAGLATQPLSGALLRNPYPALPDAARDGLELRVHLQLREDVLDVRPDGVRRHGQSSSNHLVVVAQ